MRTRFGSFLAQAQHTTAAMHFSVSSSKEVSLLRVRIGRGESEFKYPARANLGETHEAGVMRV